MTTFELIVWIFLYVVCGIATAAMLRYKSTNFCIKPMHIVQWALLIACWPFIVGVAILSLLAIDGPPVIWKWLRDLPKF